MHAPRHYFRCSDCLTPMVSTDANLSAACACGGKLTHIGRVRRHRVVRVEDHPACDARCTNATGPSCDCQCGGENHGSGRTVKVITADLGAARVTPVDAAVQLERATEYRAAVAELDAAIMRSRWGGAFADRRAGAWVDGAAYGATETIRAARRHAVGLKTHANRIKAIKALTQRIPSI